jgi:hypothetical protein
MKHDPLQRVERSIARAAASRIRPLPQYRTLPRWFAGAAEMNASGPSHVFCAACSHLKKFLIILSVFEFVSACARPVFAEERNEEPARLVEFDIPGQPLGAALERFMSLSQVAVIVDSTIVGIRRSNAIHGSFTPDGALQSLLDGTRLDGRAIGPGVYTLLRAPHAVEARPRFGDYAAAVQRAVTRALCRGDETEPFRYRTVIRLWFQPDGVATRVELAVSTGSRSGDDKITHALERLDVGSPVPSNLPQPIKLAIAPRATGAATCSPGHAALRSPAQRGMP